jgi:riboflavin kinase/FMN adenylyltransferase
MQVHHAFPRPSGPTVLAIGVFDGVHLGHQALIKQARAQADDAGLPLIVLTWGDHPDMVVRGKAPYLLTTPEEKCAEMARLGADAVVLVPFSKDLASMAPDAFVRDVLAGQMQARHVCVGYNFRFGRRASGTVETLQALAPELGFEPHVLQPVLDGDETISSSRIRALLQKGDLAQAIRLLGHPYHLSGEVVRGVSIGTEKLQTPTANLAVHERKLLPADGVYAGTVPLEGNRYLAAMNIGMRPTFEGQHRTIEVHLLGYAGDLYGHHLSVAVRHYLRPEKRFRSPAELKEQIGRDVAKARQLLMPHGELLPD